ncbi:MAG: Dyp-type peroxidase [Actinomycetota bacterium]
MTTLDLARIQGFVVRGYRLPLAAYLFLRIDDPDGAAKWISAVAEEVVTAAPWSEKPDVGLNVAFTFAGLRALVLPDACLSAFPEEFRQGMAARADLLGDSGESAPANWEGAFGTDDVHVLVMISAADPDTLAAHDARVRAAVEQTRALTVVGDARGAALASGTEHFGYADGFSQPSIEGSGASDLPGQGAPTKDGRWRPIRAGEFVLGYLDEEGVLPTAPPPAELSANGTYLVYRKLRQDVAAFRSRLSASAALYHGGEELLAAKLVGRWRDGTPLDASPAAPDAALAADEQRNNAFDYRDDAAGLRCPVGAHVRRMNPRSSLPFEGKLVNRHRLIRRGITYGDPLPPDADDAGADRGVIFMCLQASIARQFEFVQSQWVNGGNGFALGDDQDPLCGAQDGSSSGKMTIPGAPPFFHGPLSRIVTVKGGEYFFVPGINGLHFLAAAAGGGVA